jgi:hypothetical protein
MDGFYIVEGRLTPNTPNWGKLFPPNPRNELRCVFVGYVTVRLGVVGREALKIFDQMEKCIPI